MKKKETVANFLTIKKINLKAINKNSCYNFITLTFLIISLQKICKLAAKYIFENIRKQ